MYENRAACRLILLKKTKNRMVLGSMSPERLLLTLRLLIHPTSRKKGPDSSRQTKTSTWHGVKLSGAVFDGVDNIMAKVQKSRMALQTISYRKSVHPESVIPGYRLMRPLQPIALAGELLFILRPVVYGKRIVYVEYTPQLVIWMFIYMCA